jgi:GNAT superfamily N-acetyltransferase
MGKDFAEALSKAGASVRHDMRPGDIGNIIGMHGRLYASEHGYSRCLVEEAVAFCRSGGYRSVMLWTEASLTTATRLYRQCGFLLTEQKTGMTWGAERTEERYDLSLA